MDQSKLLLVGALLAGVFVLTRSKQAIAAPVDEAPSPYKFKYYVKKDPSGAPMCFETGTNKLAPLSKCSNSLSGYFPVGSFCCSNCARGLRCSG